jgi:hypothetical protein
MSLTDTQIYKLAERMQIPMGGVFFKDEIPSKLEFNKTYIINLEDSEDENGRQNSGSHWTMVQCRKYPNDKIHSIYFDPYGAPPPESVKEAVKKTTASQGVPHTTKDVQSLMNNACGFYCLALAHYINASKFRTNDLFTDVNDFVDMFDDLNVSVDFKKNEYILKHFFRSEDPSLRKEIDVIKSTESITGEDEKGGIDMMKIPCDIKMM